MVSVAHEVRVQLHDATVIFGTVIADADADVRVFVVRPWGRRSPMKIPFTDVLRASPVKGMRWEMQRSISMAQMAGVFQASRPAV